MGKCEQVLDIISKNAGKEYRSPAKISNATEAAKMTDLYSECKKGEELFVAIVDELAKKQKMISSVHRSVLDGTRRRIRSYYWGELQLEKYLDSPESISIFAEKDMREECVRFRVSLEIDGNRASNEDLKKHNSLVEIPLESGCVFGISEGAAKEIIYTENSEAVKDALNVGTAKKVQLCVLIDRSEKNQEDDYLNSMIDAVNKLMKAYKYVVK